MTPETKEKIEAGKKEVWSKFTGQVTWSVGFDYGASYGYNLAIEEVSKGGGFQEYWLQRGSFSLCLVGSENENPEWKHRPFKVIDIAALQAANARIAQLENESDHLKIANSRSVDAAYYALLEISAWLGIPEKKRDEYVKQQMENVIFCADVKNQKPLIDQSTLQLQTKLTTLEAMVEEAEEVIEEVKQVQCECSVAERDSGHSIDCWRPDLDEKINSYLQNKGG